MNWSDPQSWYVFVISPLVQVAVLWALFYGLLRALERISAAVKLKGLAMAIILIALAAMVSRVAQLHALNWLLENSISFSALILAIVFQPEVRRLFTRMGGWLPSTVGGDNAHILDQLVESVEFMAQRRIGALIVIQRSDQLGDYIGQSPLDCEINAKSLVTLFWKDSPLHDGAVIIRGGRIAAAGVILPLTENFEYKDLSGTRHRAGIGISEDTDALAVLVSEETGTISVADKGKLNRGLTREDLEILLGRIFGMRGRRTGEM
ncbi:MAG: diadenylate cyclase CdaA [Planctomycetota bacterium]|jgi:diadenylate cyclase|nr:diadenylate cyclase CdaA [Planctomycetota bacterium]